MKATLESARVFITKATGQAVLEVKYVLEDGTKGCRVTRNEGVLMAMLAKEVDVEVLSEDPHLYKSINFAELST